MRTAAAMGAILNTHEHLRFTVLSNPEFLAEGTAIRDLQAPDRVLIGGPDDAAGRQAVGELVDIYAGEGDAWVPRERILTTNVWSAELTKLAANAMLAQRVSSVNALSQLCEATGADIAEVARVMGADTRIGSKFLKAGPGFGGSCFKKDVLNLVYLCESFGLADAAAYWNQVIAMNDSQQRRIVERLFAALFNTIANKKIAIFGFAFKADTGDTRETPSGAVVRMLHEEHAHLAITDPKALPNARKDLADMADGGECPASTDKSRPMRTGTVDFTEDPYEAAKDADAVLVMTDWKLYPALDWAKVYALMRKPALVFDTRNCLDTAALRAIGFKTLNIGK